MWHVRTCFFLPLITIVQLAVIIFDDMVFERYNLVKQLEYPNLQDLYLSISFNPQGTEGNSPTIFPAMLWYVLYEIMYDK